MYVLPDTRSEMLVLTSVSVCSCCIVSGGGSFAGTAPFSA